MNGNLIIAIVITLIVIQFESESSWNIYGKCFEIKEEVQNIVFYFLNQSFALNLLLHFVLGSLSMKKCKSISLNRKLHFEEQLLDRDVNYECGRNNYDRIPQVIVIDLRWKNTLQHNPHLFKFMV